MLPSLSLLPDASKEQLSPVQLLVKLTLGAEFDTGGGGLLTGFGIEESLPPPHAARRRVVQLISRNFLDICIISMPTD